MPATGRATSKNIPGGILNSESNSVYGLTAGGKTAGLADYGTRLKATFNNIPAGLRIFVSTSNVNNAATFVPAPAVVGGSAANQNAPAGYIGYAQLVNGETTSDGNAGTAGFFPSVSPTDNSPSTSGNVPLPALSTPTATATPPFQ